MAEHIVNGVNTTELKKAMQMLKDHPDAARFQFRAKNRWAGGEHCYTTIQDFSVGGQEDTSRSHAFVLEAGEPKVLLGSDEGPNATEALLYALGSCLNTSLIIHAAAKNIEVQELQIDLEGDLDARGFLGIADNVRNGFQEIRVTFRVRADVPEDQIRELCEMAQNRSPVFDIVTHQVPVHASVEVLGKEKVAVGV